MRSRGNEMSIGAGLCNLCEHQRVVRNTRGSSFSLCERSRSQPEYARYPRLPVRDCPGYEPRQGNGAPDSDPSD